MINQKYYFGDDCIWIELSREYLIDCKDKFFISYIQKNNKIDFITAKRRYITTMVLCGIIFFGFLFLLFFPSFRIMNLWFFTYIWFIPFCLIFFYYLFYFSPVTEIQKDKIISIKYKKYPQSIAIKFKKGKFIKKRLIFLSNNKEQLEKMLQCLRENRIL